MRWSAKQYTKFESERTRPVRDLLAAIPTTDVQTAVDIGCGPGNSTALLCRQFPGAAVRGIDHSSEMLAAARKRLPGVHFENADIAAWAASDARSRRYGVILANAALHWLPDHAALFASLVAKLVPGGSLAVQMPDNLDEPTHRLMREIAADGPWTRKLAGAAAIRAERHGAPWYFETLRKPCATVDVWRTTYHHALAGHGALVEWFKGSGLRPFLAPLDDRERAEFLDRYQTALESEYPIFDDGAVLLPFPRLFIVATR